MGEAVVTMAEDTRALAAAVVMRAGLVVATVELELTMVLAAMARGIIHPESQRGATAATGKGFTHREPRRGIRFIVLLPVRKAEPLPGNLPGRQSILVATTSHEINLALALRASPPSSRVIMLGQIGIYARSARARLQKVQPALATLGLDRI